MESDLVDGEDSEESVEEEEEEEEEAEEQGFDFRRGTAWSNSRRASGSGSGARRGKDDAVEDCEESARSTWWSAEKETPAAASRTGWGWLCDVLF